MPPDTIKDLDFIFEVRSDITLRERALKIGLGMISRSLEAIEWRVEEEGDYAPDSLYYHLNVRPNKNQNASEFWSAVVYKLFYDGGECLIVKSDDDQLLVADSWQEKEYALMNNVYHDVVINGYEYERSFDSDQVLFLEHKNRGIRNLVNTLDQSYGELFARAYEVALRSGQVRGKVKISGQMSKSKNAVKTIQDYIDKLYGAFRTNSVAIVPEMDGMEYEESSNDARNISRVEEMDAVANSYLDTVLQALGIHPSLCHGGSSKTNIQFHQNQYIISVVRPLVTMIERELNSKFFTEQEYLSGSRVKANLLNLEHSNIFSLGTAVEKLIGSQAFSPNEIREAAGYNRVDDPLMDEYYRTKNIESADVAEGGEDNRQADKDES